MKKQIYCFPNGDIAIVEGNPEIQLGKSLPIKSIELDMDEETFRKWADNPKKYKLKFEKIAKNAFKFKTGKGTVRLDKEKIKIKVKDLTLDDKQVKIKSEELMVTQEGETTT